MMDSIKLFILLIFSYISLSAQTDIDGLMMKRNFLCIGATGGYSEFKYYWEGTLKRENLNFGSISSLNTTVMGNFGVSNKVNLLFSLPYIKTYPNAGNMDSEYGLQDLSLWGKYNVWKSNFSSGVFNLFIIGGFSIPTTNYAADFQPLSIGLHSHQGTGRLLFDFHRKKLSLTASASFIYRSNVIIDRGTYYTTEMHYSNVVEMPNASNVNVRIGHRDEHWIVEGIYDYSHTFGGYDMPRNGMPFLSNNVRASRAGLYIKYETPIDGLSILLNGMTTVDGRNIGKNNNANLGIFYIFDFTKKEKENTNFISEDKKN